jgi:hypothetical protein
VYHRDEKVINCFNALKDTVIPDGWRVHTFVGFNGGSPELKNYLVSWEGKLRFFDTINPAFYQVLDYGENLGKPAIVNRMVDSMADSVPFNYVLSYDSDLVAQDPEWLWKFVEAFEFFPKWKDLGALSAQQTGHCCHVLKNSTSYSGSNYSESRYAGYTYQSVPRNEGIAGGAILTPYHVWRTIGGYLANRIYGADDAHYALALHQHNLLMCVVDQVSLYHPPGDDPAYSEWKQKACRDGLSGDELKGFYH